MYVGRYACMYVWGGAPVPRHSGFALTKAVPGVLGLKSTSLEKPVSKKQPLGRSVCDTAPL